MPSPVTTATQLAQSVDLSDAKGAALIVIGLLVAFGVVLWGARLVLDRFDAYRQMQDDYDYHEEKEARRQQWADEWRESNE
jgi:hypothetical protein